MKKKPLYLKTRLWVNLAALVGVVVIYFTGMSLEQWGTISAGALTIINVLLSIFSGEVMDDTAAGTPTE